MPGRSAGLGGLGRGTAVVAGPGEQFLHDLGGADDGLASEFGLDGPALTGPGQSRPGRPVQLAVWQVVAHPKLAGRPDRAANPQTVLIPGGKIGVWIFGGIGFLVVLAGIGVSLVPPGDSTDKLKFEMKLVFGTVAAIALGLILYWRGVREKREAGVES